MLRRATARTTDTSFAVEFPPDGVSLERLQAGLERIFRGTLTLVSTVL
jgi:hypothetical protein